MASQWHSGTKPPANAGDAQDVGLIPELGRSPGVGIGNPLQYSCLENSMDEGTWWVTVYGVTKIRLSERAHTHTFLCLANYLSLLFSLERTLGH